MSSINKKGRSKDISYLRTSDLSQQPFSIRRLVKDYLEMEHQKIPTVGVAAKPLDNNIYVWHANIKGPAGTPYSGGVFHLEINFPMSYPHAPPEIKLLTPVPHPNVIGDSVCLDMTQPVRQEGRGWTSAYSVQSVLLQLQSFLFEKHREEETIGHKNLVSKAIEDANEYKCKNRFCRHGGRLSAWPAFNSHEEDVAQFVEMDSENQIFLRELICYHAKTTHKENILGIGLRVSKVPRSGMIKEAEIFPYYLSARSFIKEFVRWSPLNEKYTHWLPLFFNVGGEEEEKRYMKFVQGSLSMIMTGNAKSFRPSFVLDVFPKVFVTLISRIMDQKTYPSLNSIRFLTQIHANFLFLLSKFPELAPTIEQTIDKFIGDEAQRHKNNTPNLGSFLALFLAAKRPFSEARASYSGEQMDRHIFWISLQIGQLLMTLEKDKARIFTVDEMNVAFKSQITSYQIFCFQKMFIENYCQKEGVLKHYLQNQCRLPDSELHTIQKNTFAIFKDVTSVEAYNKYIGQPCPSPAEFTKNFKEAIQRSNKKGYHGEQENVNKLVSSQEQVDSLLKDMPSDHTFFKVTETGKGKELKYKIEDGGQSESAYSAACTKRWGWVQDYLRQCEATPLDVYELLLKKLSMSESRQGDRLFERIGKRSGKSIVHEMKGGLQKPKLSWKQLFLLYDFIEHIRYLDFTADLKGFYRKLNVLKSIRVSTLVIPYFLVSKLKSDYHFITATLEQLPSLRRVDILSRSNHCLDLKFIKCLNKGFRNFIENKGKLEFISFWKVQCPQNEVAAELMVNYLGDLPSIRSMTFIQSNVPFTLQNMKKLGSFLDRHKTLEEIKFVRVQFREPATNELADSLMRVKPLKYFTATGCSGFGKGIASLAYNLSFSPSLLTVDFSCNTFQPAEIKELSVSLMKLIKMNTSLRVLSLSFCSNFNPQLKDEFWTALGDNQSLKVLDLANSGTFLNPAQIGRGIAFNAKRKGSLETITLDNTMDSNKLVGFYKGLWVSDFDQEIAYGDASKANKMEAESRKQSYFNNLKHLPISLGVLHFNFNLAQWNKHYNKEDHELTKLIARSAQLQSLEFKSCKLAKEDSDLLALALDSSRPHFVSNLRVLNLSKNNICMKTLGSIIGKHQTLQVLDISKNNLGVSGGVNLAKAIAINKSIKFLNVFNNKISFNGAVAFGEALASNNVLQFLQLGHNRIRDKGLRLVIEGIAKNPKSAVNTLALRFNFLTQRGVQHFVKAAAKTKVREAFLGHNSINQSGLFHLQQFFEENKVGLVTDLFEKLRWLQNLDRTVWIFPFNRTPEEYKHFFEKEDCGIVTDVRCRSGVAYPGKSSSNTFGFVEFAHPDSVKRALAKAASKETVIASSAFRVFKAGSGTFIFTKKSAKQQKREQEFKQGVQPEVKAVRPPRRTGRKK